MSGSKTTKGTEARFSVLTYRGNTSLERSAAVLRDDLKPLGIAVDVSVIEQGALIERMVKGDFDAIFFVYFASAARARRCRWISG